MKIRIPSKTVCACDICERESASSLLDKCVVCGREYCCTCRAIMCGCVHQPDVCKKCGDNEAVRAAVETFAPRISRVLDARDVVLSGLGAVALKASDRKRKSANDSSSETAEGGGGLAQPVPNGGAQESRPESADAPDAEAQAVTDRSRPERFSAAPLLAVADFRDLLPHNFMVSGPLELLALVLLGWVWVKRKDFWELVPVRLAVALLALALVADVGSVWLRWEKAVAASRGQMKAPQTPPPRTKPEWQSKSDAASRDADPAPEPAQSDAESAPPLLLPPGAAAGGRGEPAPPRYAGRSEEQARAAQQPTLRLRAFGSLVAIRLSRACQP